MPLCMLFTFLFHFYGVSTKRLFWNLHEPLTWNFQQCWTVKMFMNLQNRLSLFCITERTWICWGPEANCYDLDLGLPRKDSRIPRWGFGKGIKSWQCRCWLVRTWVLFGGRLLWVWPARAYLSPGSSFSPMLPGCQPLTTTVTQSKMLCLKLWVLSIYPVVRKETKTGEDSFNVCNSGIFMALFQLKINLN